MVLRPDGSVMAVRMTGLCKDCRWWDTELIWLPNPRFSTRLDEARACMNPDSKMFSQHPAGADYEGRPGTLPDFGCVEFTMKESGHDEA